MTMTLLRLCLVMCFLGCLSPVLNANELCDVKLGHGLIITKDIIRIVDKGQARVQINDDSQLFIKGRWIELNEQETEVLRFDTVCKNFEDYAQVFFIITMARLNKIAVIIL